MNMNAAANNAITYREATTVDIPALAKLRWEMEVERHGTQFSLEVYTEAFDRAMRADMERGSFRAWVAEAEGSLVACVVLLWSPFPPHFEQIGRKRGFVSSVYTRPEYRRSGIGRTLMRMLLDASRQLGVTRLVLWASDMGRPLYEELGFTPSRAMEINL
jgi:ribosomal protein S18 acetylase RimI-like enzyme